MKLKHFSVQEETDYRRDDEGNREVVTGYRVTGLVGGDFDTPFERFAHFHVFEDVFEAELLLERIKEVYGEVDANRWIYSSTSKDGQAKAWLADGAQEEVWFDGVRYAVG